MHRRLRLAGRLAICQILGTFAGIATGTRLSQIWAPFPPPDSLTGNGLLDLGVMLIFGLGFGIPFYCVALLILHNATRSVLDHPLIWCIGVPAILLAAALFAFPPTKVHGIFWIALIPLCALFAGAIFYVWLRESPLRIE
jgi:hypothetical protein